MKRSRAALLIVAKVTISAGLLLLVFRRLGSADIAAQLQQVDYSIVVFALIPQLMAVLAMAMRWHVLAVGLLTLLQTVRYTFIGLFYGALLPGGVSGDVAKGAVIAWQDESTRTAVLPASILADRLVGFYVLGLFFSAACAWMLWRPPGDSDLLAQLGGTGLLLSAPVVILLPLSVTYRGRRLAEWFLARAPLWPGLRGPAKRLLAVLETYASRRNLWTRVLLLSTAVHACNVVIYLIVLNALQISVPMHLTIVLYAVLSMLFMIPISVSGLGVREWFMIAFFPAIDLAAEAGVAFSLTCMAVTWTAAALGGAWHLLDLLSLRRGRASALLQFLL